MPTQQGEADRSDPAWQEWMEGLTEQDIEQVDLLRLGFAEAEARLTGEAKAIFGLLAPVVAAQEAKIRRLSNRVLILGEDALDMHTWVETMGPVLRAAMKEGA